MEELQEIRKRVPMTEMLAGLAEEAAELAQAALKLRRAYDMVNPTPTGVPEATQKLYEEIADVYLYIEALSLSEMDLEWRKRSKMKRWLARLQWAEEEAE